MSPLIARVRLAREVRRSRCSLSEAAAQLCDVGLNDVLFQITNIELQLEELYLQLMEPLAKVAPRRRRPEPPEHSDQIPF